MEEFQGIEDPDGIKDSFFDLLQYDITNKSKVCINMPNHVVLQELREMRILSLHGWPVNEFTLGNHSVNITKNKKTDDEKTKEYYGLFWLMHNRLSDGFECEMHVEAVSKFHLYKLGLTILVVNIAGNQYKLVNNLKKYKDVTITFENVEDIDVDNLTRETNIPWKNIHINTELFGSLRAPTLEEMNEFIKFAKLD